jgi:acyl-CoA synthetase (AMP-forming)/AMP-acid ligase II
MRTMLLDELTRFADAPALIAEGSERISYRQLLSAADTVARAVRPRCLAFLLCRNSPGSIAAYLGLSRAGAVPLLLNDTIHDSLLQTLVETYSPRYLIVSSSRPAVPQGFAPECSVSETAVLRRREGPDHPLDGCLGLLLTTSGSTGSPKLVRLSHENLTENARAIAEYLDIAPADRPITTMPMAYAYGLSILNSHLIRGASVVLSDASLTERRFWETLGRERVTTFGGVPYSYEMLRRLGFDRMVLPSLRYLTQAGGRLGPELVREFAAACAAKGMRFYVMYGQTEATARIAYLPPEEALARPGSVGIPIPGGELWLEDESGRRVDGAGLTGELVYRGRNVCLGYAEAPPDLAAGDVNRGVLRTGDLARRDADGFYTIAGRKKRFVKLFGDRLSLDEVEQLLQAAGYDCACDGRDDLLSIYVVSSERTSSVKAFLSERIGLHPSALRVVDVQRIPRSASGKVLYAELAR